MHEFPVRVEWTGAGESGTGDRKAYTRDYDVLIEGKPAVAGSSAPAYKGDASRHNPEDMLVAAVSACHMLWYLHLCAAAGITVTAYADDATGRLATHKDGSGEFEEVVLRPRVTLAPGADEAEAESLHARASELCFIARSLSCPVRHDPVFASA